jgi:hypothetical protein
MLPMISTTEHVVWGYVLPADDPEDEQFLPCGNEADAREWVRLSLPGARALAKRTLGPVELVDE